MIKELDYRDEAIRKEKEGVIVLLMRGEERGYNRCKSEIVELLESKRKEMTDFCKEYKTAGGKCSIMKVKIKLIDEILGEDNG